MFREAKNVAHEKEMPDLDLTPDTVAGHQLEGSLPH